MAAGTGLLAGYSFPTSELLVCRLAWARLFESVQDLLILWMHTLPLN